jgi:hypothetical protein
MASLTPENHFQVWVMGSPTPKMFLGADLTIRVLHVFLILDGKAARS